VTPSEVKAYLAERQRAPLGDIAVHFGSSPDAVRQVLQVWLNKGRVRRLSGGAGCPGKAGCSCSARIEEVYEWVQ
jgi:putative ferrous iron transport protein C